MAFLIDGNNLIGHISCCDLKSRESRYRLVFKLLRFQKIKKSKVTIVFDGPPDRMLSSLNSRRFTLLFSDSSLSADAKIKEILSSKKYLRDITVVTSDRELILSAKSLGARIIRCAEFHKQVKKLLREKKRDDRKEDRPLSPLEVNHWLEVFKKKR